MTLPRYLIRRACFALVMIVVVSSVALLLTLAAPGDFTTQQEFGADAPTLAARRAQLGLDRPVIIQYASWMSRAVRFDFGDSLLYTRPVADLLAERALNTAVLAVTALVTATLVGIPLGVYTASRQRGLGLRVIQGLSLILLSTPPLVASFGLVMLAVRTGWLPAGGMISAGAGGLSWGRWLLDVARHVPLPALALALPLAAVLERLQSQAMRASIREPFVSAARARGLSADQARLRHGWRVSLASVLGLYGVMIGALFSGSFVVEVVTAWPGLGRLMYDALRARDLYLVAGSAATGALYLAIGTFASDLMLAAADPRVRQGTRT